MALTSRAKRDINFSATSVPETLGPGSYNPNDITKWRTSHSQAPFSSTTHRNHASAEAFVTPGPGYYQDPLNDSMRGRSKKQSSVFASKSDRMLSDKEGPKAALMPGPGTYDRKDKGWIKQNQAAPRDTSPGKAINWVKVATAPSIPGANQSYGYEEGAKGELIQQKPPSMGFTGKPADSAGPGQYDANLSLVKKSTPGNVAFGKSKGTRDALGVSKDAFTRPGPGAYETEPVQDEEMIRPSPAFLSATTRSKADKMSNKNETPGPGSYSAPKLWKTQAEQSANVPEHIQAFGSTSRKQFQPVSEQHPVQVHNPHIPGPGSYDAKNGAFPRQPQHPMLNEAPSHGAFDSTGARFKTSKATAKATPGPGHYNADKSGIAASVQRKIVGRYGVFGTTSQRFPTKQDDSVGPGAYEDKVNMNPEAPGPRKKDPRQAIFASKTKRSPQPKDKVSEAAPAVGSYSVPGPEWVKKSNSCADKLLDNAPRFKEEKKLQVPGPGYYDTNARTLEEKVHGPEVLNKGQLRKATYRGLDRSGYQKPFGPQSLRFTPDEAKAKQPGPGSYDPQSSMLKKTFNITIGESWA